MWKIWTDLGKGPVVGNDDLYHGFNYLIFRTCNSKYNTSVMTLLYSHIIFFTSKEHTTTDNAEFVKLNWSNAIHNSMLHLIPPSPHY
jgi:hypothetical protein